MPEAMDESSREYGMDSIEVHVFRWSSDAEAGGFEARCVWTGFPEWICRLVASCTLVMGSQHFEDIS